MGSLPGAPARRKAGLFFCGLTAATLLASSLFLTGCKPKPVASVNGQSLGEEEFHKLCETATQIQPQAGTVGMQTLVKWLRNTIMAQEAKKQGVYPSDAELNARVDAVRKNAQFAGASFEEELRRQGLTLEAFKREMLADMISENLMTKGVTVSDEEVRKRYEEQKSTFQIPEQVQISQITVASENDMKKVRNELGPTAQFSVVANTYSKDPFAQSGGRVPMPLSRQGMPGGPVPKEAVDAAFKLQPGQVSDPIKSGANWVFVKLEEKIPAKEPKFEDIRELMRSAIKRERAQGGGQAQQLQQQLFNSFRQAKVEVFRPEYKSLVDQIQAQAGGGAPAGPGGPGGPPPGAGADGHGPHDGHDHGPADGHGPGDGHDHGAPGAGAPPPPPPGG